MRYVIRAVHPLLFGLVWLSWTVMAVVMAVRLTRWTETWGPQAALAWVRQTTGIPVYADDIRVRLVRGEVIFDEVRLGDDPAPEATAKRVRVARIWTSNIRIEADRPYLRLVQQSDGKWNITRYIPEGGEPTTPTRSFDIRVRDGQVDLDALIGGSRLQRSVSALTGRALVAGQALSLRAYARERQGYIDAYGVGYGPTVSLRLGIRALDVTDMPGLFGVSQVRLSHALADGTVWVTLKPSGVQVAGEVTGTSSAGVINVPGATVIPAQAMQARVSFSNDQIRFRSSASLLSGVVEAEGGGLVSGAPELQMAVRFRSVRPDRLPVLRRLLPMGAEIRAPVTGQVKLAFGPQGLTMRAIDMHGMTAFRSQEIQLTRADVEWGRGNASWIVAARFGNARVRSHGAFTPNQVSAQLVVRDLQLSQLRGLPYSVSGVTNLDALLTGRPDSPSVQVAGTVRNARYLHYHAPLVSIRAEGGLPRLQVSAWIKAGRLGAGRIDGETDLKRQHMDARIIWRDLQADALAKLLKMPEKPPFAALLSVYGRMDGRWTDPKFQGTVSAADLVVNGFEFDTAGCDIQFSRDRLELRHAQVRRGLSEILADAQVERPLEAGRRISVSALMRTIDLHDLMEIAGRQLKQPDLGGAFDGLMQARWDGKEWWASTVVESNAITVDDLIVSGVHLEADWVGEALVLHDSRASVGQGTLAMDGRWMPNDGWRARLDARNVPLSWVERYLPESVRQPVLGVFDASVTAEGSKGIERASASVTASRCTMDTFELNGASASADLKDGVISLGPLHLDTPYGSLSIESGTYDVADARYNVAGRLRLHSVQKLAAAVQESRLATRNNANLAGVISGLQVDNGTVYVQLRAEGQKEQVTVDGDVAVDGIVLRGLPTGRILAHVSGSPQTELRVTDGQYEGLGGVGLLTGEFNKQGAKASVDLFNIDAGALGRVIPGFAAVSGQVDVSVLMDGPYNSPNLTGSLVVSNPGFGDLRAKLLVSQNIRLGDGYLTIPELVLKQSADAVRVNAKIPIKPGGFTPDPDRPLEAQATVDRQPVQTLLEFIPMSGLKVGGDWQARLTVGGAINNPAIAGEINLMNGSVALDKLSTGLKQIDGNVQFYGDRVHASVTATNTHDSKGQLIFNGEVNHLMGTPAVEGALSARQFAIHESNASGFLKERVDGVLTGDITFSGPLKSPVISGTMTSRQTRVSLPGAAALPASERTPPAYNPLFKNVTLVIDDGVFRLPRIDARGAGRLVLNGSLSNPELSGGVNVTHGKLYFPTTVFRIEPPATVQVAYPVPGQDPFVLTTNMRASSRMRIYGGYGLGRSYLVRMELTGPLVGGTARMRFTSEPPTASEQEIIDALGVGILKNVLDSGSTGKLEQELGNIVTASLLSPVFSPLESGLETALGLSEVRLDYRQNEAMSVMLVKQLGGPFSLSYWRMFDRISPQYELRLLYDAPAWLGVMRSTQFSLMINERQETTWGFIAGLRF